MVLFGDSITQRGWSVGGWGARLADTYGRRADVLNRGYSGYNSAEALHLLPAVFPGAAEAPALVTVFLGANDASSQPAHHVPVAAYAANLRAIAAHVRDAYGERTALVFITPPPVGEAARVRANHERWGTPLEAPPERSNAVTGKYAAACREVAEELGCALVDIFSGFQEAPAWQETHLNDGLHFAPAGDQALHAALMEVIAGRLAHLAPGEMPYDFPEWSDVDAADATTFKRNVCVAFQPQ